MAFLSSHSYPRQKREEIQGLLGRKAELSPTKVGSDDKNK
jgi:hypothetical protein